LPRPLELAAPSFPSRRVIVAPPQDLAQKRQVILSYVRKHGGSGALATHEMVQDASRRGKQACAADCTALHTHACVARRTRRCVSVAVCARETASRGGSLVRRLVASHRVCGGGGQVTGRRRRLSARCAQAQALDDRTREELFHRMELILQETILENNHLRVRAWGSSSHGRTAAAVETAACLLRVCCGGGVAGGKHTTSAVPRVRVVSVRRALRAGGEGSAGCRACARRQRQADAERRGA
jgi:hypothetical protein